MATRKRWTGGTGGCNPLRPAARAFGGIVSVALPALLFAMPAFSEDHAGAPASAANAGYVGSATCRPCHEAAFAAWQGSDHDRAMQQATTQTVLGNFHDQVVEAYGVKTTFSERDGAFFVRTDGADGAPADFQVKYTFGVRPLQQYLVEFPGGRLQALPVAWDTRPAEAGGQRWFHLYPDEKIDHQDQLHWAGLYQNWNLQCAACHSTNLRKNYDAAGNRYATTYAEIDVACESCHGGGAAHTAWAASAHAPYATGDKKGLHVVLRRSPARQWLFATLDARYASLDPAAAADPGVAATMNVCVPCHARRSSVDEAAAPGTPLEDNSRVALLTEPLYFADGQQHDEVFTWGSFLQSRMYARGVVCGDCHDSHTLKTRAAGNGLCSRCHNPAVFDTKAHHFHEPGGKGAQCVDCHMPARNYMVIDGRHDHSFRVPRPDISETTGSPDVCSGCHAEKTRQWSAETMDRWYGPAWRQRPEYGSALHSAASEGAKALPRLLSMAADKERPAIVRATAAELARPLVRPGSLRQIRSLLADDDALLRLAAVGLLGPFDADTRATGLAPLLAEPRRAVRMEVARLLADVPDERLSQEQRSQRADARREYLDTLQADADWPAAMANLGNFLLREGRIDDAITAYEKARRLDPRFAGAYGNLADALRAQGKDDDAERVLRGGLDVLPQSGALHHALGLLLVRKGDKTAALGELAAAVRLDPASARFAYVHAVALKSMGDTEGAMSALRDGDRRHPYDPDILGTLVSMNLEAGRPGSALPYARRLAEALPEDQGIQALVTQLEATREASHD